jgi:hypothetical protein
MVRAVPNEESIGERLESFSILALPRLELKLSKFPAT